MATDGIDSIILETHNWGKSAKFLQNFGFALEFETGHGSGQLRNGAGLPVFVAEIPADRDPRTVLVLRVDDEAALDISPDVEIVTPFEDTHYGTREMTVRDPDGRIWSLQSQPDGER